MLTSEAAERLGITKRSVARLIKRGIIKAEKRGRDYWIEDEEVERYRQERKVPGRPKTENLINNLGSTTTPDTTPTPAVSNEKDAPFEAS